MNAILLQCVVASALLTSPVSAQRAAPLVSPELLPDGAVVFRMKAPAAKEVRLVGQFGPAVALAKDAGGVWSVTVPKVPAGVHEYHFSVDGLDVIDPLNPWIKPQRWPGSSILHVPSVPPAPWDWQDVPHGTVHEHFYQSKALGPVRRIFVYTPPGSGADPLPVLYLSHGYSDNEATWTVHGKAHWIMDALIAEKKAVPMILVMPDAHAIPPGEGGFEKYGPANSAALCRELKEDIMPLVESVYRVKSGREHRAFAGLSMGGHHALTFALNHHADFGWIGAFSPAPPPNDSVASGLDDPKPVNDDLKLLWVACGKDDFLAAQNRGFDALLTRRGVRHEMLWTEGGHSWPVWRRYLADFTPKLFR